MIELSQEKKESTTKNNIEASTYIINDKQRPNSEETKTTFKTHVSQCFSLVGPDQNKYILRMSSYIEVHL